MPQLRPFALLFSLGLLAACTTPPTQYLLAPEASAPQFRSRLASVEVRDISLPRYATADSIALMDETGAMISDPNSVWADDPQRALTQGLARQLHQITGARVAAEPWPFAGPPSATLSVVVDQIYASDDGTVRMSGQYALAPIAANISDRSGSFDFPTAINGEGPAAIADAHSRALVTLAATIAQKALR